MMASPLVVVAAAAAPPPPSPSPSAAAAAVVSAASARPLAVVALQPAGAGCADDLISNEARRIFSSRLAASSSVCCAQQVVGCGCVERASGTPVCVGPSVHVGGKAALPSLTLPPQLAVQPRGSPVCARASKCRQVGSPICAQHAPECQRRETVTCAWCRSQGDGCFGGLKLCGARRATKARGPSALAPVLLLKRTVGVHEYTHTFNSNV